MHSDGTQNRHDSLPVRNGAALAATVALVNSMLSGADCARAQDPLSPTATGSAAPEQMPEVEVTGSGGDGYNAESLSLPQFQEPLLTTPRSASVVTKQLMQDENVSTLRDALRNVSGISIGAGEGSYQGDNFSIRGFPSRNDIYLDGMNDFGNYNRDPFNIEEVEVLKGPSSAEFGRGSSGGVVNEETKEPELEGFTAGSATYGTDNQERGTLDFNQPISRLPGSAFRLNLMGQHSDVTDRDDAVYNRWGVAPSLSLGLGTPTRVTISYFHQSEDNRPDFGIPWLFDRPAPAPRNTFYGFSDDSMKTNVNIGTIRIEHDFNDIFTLGEQFRDASYGRDFRITEGQVVDGVTPATPLDDIQVERNIIDGDGTDKLIDEDLRLLSTFDTGPVHNSLVAGFEYVHESDFTTRVEPGWEDVPNTSLLHPTNPAFPGFGPVSTATAVNVDTLSAYLIHTMKFGSQWSLIGGLRFDDVSSSYRESISPPDTLLDSDALWSWRAALVFQPLPNGSIYLSAGNSVHPNIAQISLSSETTLPPNAQQAAIGRNLEVELGTKWDLFDKRFSVESAVFWDEETNAAPVDLDDPIFIGVERAVGFEFGGVGHLTDAWQLVANYTLEYTKILSSNVPGMAGNPALNAPKDTFSLWTTYNLPWSLQVGAGCNLLSARYASNVPDPANGLLMQAPGYIIFSAMLKYQINKDVSIQANLDNLTNKYYYDGVHPGHIIPGEGRTLFISTQFKF
jgi:catecholate siderophore receptor